MTCDFMPFLTLFQSYQDDGRVVMKAPYNEGPFRIRHNLASCRPSTFKQETKFYKSYRQLVMVQFRFLIMTHLIWPDDYVVMFFFCFFFVYLFIYFFRWFLLKIMDFSEFRDRPLNITMVSLQAIES